jgi:hypothetical protein
MIEKPDLNSCTEKQFEKWYWQDYHDMCNKCKNACKQSRIVELSCPSFKNIEVKVSE